MTKYMIEFQTAVIFVLLAGFTLASCEIDDYTSYLKAAIGMIEKAKEHVPQCIEGHKSRTVRIRNAVDCVDVMNNGNVRSDVYEILPVNRGTNGKTLKLYCDMDTDGGGWTVIQRRGNFGKANDYFDKDWKDYKKGFAVRMEQDFWLGNENIFALTNKKDYSVRFEMKDTNGEHTYALYKHFRIDDENHKYMLHISNYTGNAGNAMEELNNKMFSTKDQDNTSTGYCGKKPKGGWWFHNCPFTNLNGVYHRRNYDDLDGIFWQNRSLVWTEIKIRPKYYRF